MHKSESWTFEGFYGGPENRLIAEAFSAVAQRPGTLYNPIYLYGPPGVGKSCLADSLAARMRKYRHGCFVQRISGCTSSDGYRLENVQGRLHPRPGEHCLLIVEDLDRLARETDGQAALSTTCEVLARRKCQILLTARCRPWLLPLAEEHLRSRFAPGLVLELKAPGVEARSALLEAFARRRQIPLPQSAAHMLARGLLANASQLHETLLLLDDAARLEDQTINAALVQRFLADRTVKNPGIEHIARHVASHFGVSLRSMRSKDRARAVNRARQLAMYLARSFGRSAEEIARYFGNRHSSTVSHACRKIKQLHGSDKRLADDFQLLQNRVSLPE